MNAATLTAIDVTYVVRGVISEIYMLDAAVEVALICMWANVAVTYRAERTRPSMQLSAQRSEMYRRRRERLIRAVP